MLAERCWSPEDAIHRARLWANQAGHPVYVSDIQVSWYVCESRVGYARSVTEVKPAADQRAAASSEEKP